MAVNCLAHHSVAELMKHVKDFDIGKMYDMTTKERFNLFSKYLSDDEAFFVNKEFEKAIVSSQADALEKWVNDTFTTRKQKQKKKSVIDDIKEINNILGTRDADTIEGLITEKMGVDVTAEEFQKISEFSDELEALSEGEQFGSPTIEYFKKQKEMNDYIQSLAPTHKLKVATGTVGRGMMLLSLKSTVTNIVGNTTLAVSESLSKRLSNMAGKGLNGKFAMEWWKHNQKVFQASGYDLSRMRDLSGTQRRLGEETTSSQGPGLVRATGRLVEDIVFKQLLGAPDVAFSSAHFVDSINLHSTQIARQEGAQDVQARALEMFEDAVKVNPQTPEGQELRTKAIKDAEEGTYTDENTISRWALKIRESIDAAVPNLQLGQLTVPFVKTPANVVMRGLESSGILLPADAWKLGKGLRNKGDAGAKEDIRDGLNGMARAGVGMLGAYLVMSAFEPEDYIGEYGYYSSKEKALIKSERASYNSLKIGNSWISLDYFGPFAAPLVGMLNAKKYGKGGFDNIKRYFQGVGSQIMRIPGLDEAVEFFGRTIPKWFDSDTETNEIAREAASGMIDFVSSRTIPGIMTDVAKVVDSHEREIKFKPKIGELELLDPFQRKIPGWSKGLDPQHTLFGEPIKTQPAWAQLAFGARYREGKGNEIYNELNRLNAAKELPAITDIRWSIKKVKELGKRIGTKKLNKAFNDFGKEWKTLILGPDGIESDSYKEMSDDEKRLQWNKWKNAALKEMLFNYGD